MTQMRIMRPAGRMVLVANAVAALLGVWFLLRSNALAATAGPARSDDLPYGDLLAMSHSGAVLWLVVAGAGVAAAVLNRRVIALAVGAAWAVLAVVAFIIAVTESDTLGFSRPGNAAAALSLAMITAVAGVIAAAPSPSML